MKKAFLTLLLAIFSFNLFSATQLPKYEPYKESEFPSWLKKIHRAEVIAFGATALTYPVVGLATSSIYDDSKTEDFLKKLGISFAAGALISLIDFIIGEVNEKNNKPKTGYKEVNLINYEP